MEGYVSKEDLTVGKKIPVFVSKRIISLLEQHFGREESKNKTFRDF